MNPSWGVEPTRGSLLSSKPAVRPPLTGYIKSIGGEASHGLLSSTSNTPSPEKTTQTSILSGTNPDQAYQFAFIDVSSKDARKKARSHVMRDYMRQRRGEDDSGPVLKREERSASADSHQPLEGTQLATASTALVRKVRKKRSVDVTRSESPDPNDVRTGQLVARLSNSSLSSPSRSQSPSDQIGSNRGDPFQTFPMKLDEQDSGLVDHYITVVPELMCNFKEMRLKSGTTANTFNPTKDIILPQTMNNPITFQATALAFAAGHLARLHGKENTPRSIWHRMQTVRKLREHFFQQHSHSDDLDIMVAMLSLSSCEDRFGDNATAWVHMRECIAMLERLSGKLDWKKDRRLYTYMNWVLITMTGYDSCAVMNIASPSGSPTLSFLTPPTISLNTNTPPELKATIQAIQEFFSFLKAAHVSNRTTSSTSQLESPSSRRASMFQPGSPLHTLLSSVPGARPGVRSTQIQKSCRFACALFLNGVLLELHFDPTLVEEYLKRLYIRMIEQELDYNQSTETLMWILLFGDEKGEEEHGQNRLTWFVGRMTNVAKRLSDVCWAEIGAEMIKCLMREPEEEADQFEADLERWMQEFMWAPLSSYPASVQQSLDNG